MVAKTQKLRPLKKYTEGSGSDTYNEMIEVRDLDLPGDVWVADEECGLAPVVEDAHPVKQKK